MKLLLFPIFYPRVAVFAIALVLYILMGGQAKAVELRQDGMIEGSVITLGDIFSGLSRNSDKVLGPAPRPGADMVLNARTLYRIATALDVQWRPVDSSEQLILKRAATIIEKDQIRTALVKAIHESGHNGDFELGMGAQAEEIILPFNEPATFEITDLKIDPQTDRFEASISAPSVEKPLQTRKISGMVHSVEMVPVLTNTVRNGTTITQSDIDYTPIRTADLNHDVILNPENLIGTTPRRMLSAGKPIKANEIELPRIVERGQLVTMVFKSGPMELTAMGKAMESGAKGDIIRIVNAASSRTVQGIVSAEKEVLVKTF